MSRQVTKQKHVKDNYNAPTDFSGNSVCTLRGGAYTRDQLKDHAISHGYIGRVFDEEDGLDCYWVRYLTGGDSHSEILISVYGEVAGCFDLNAEERHYKILLTQWDYQFVPSWFEPTKEEKELAAELECSTDSLVLERLKQTQKYLKVNFNNNEIYTVTHGDLRLHSLVGITHSDVPLDATWWDEKNQIYRLKPRSVVDHLDKNKSNNSKFNLYWSTGEQNTVMIDWTIQQKRQFYRDAIYLDSGDREQVVRRVN